jgi:hypothetical protein
VIECSEEVINGDLVIVISDVLGEEYAFLVGEFDAESFENDQEDGQGDASCVEDIVHFEHGEELIDIVLELDQVWEDEVLDEVLELTERNLVVKVLVNFLKHILNLLLSLVEPQRCQ